MSDDDEKFGALGKGCALRPHDLANLVRPWSGPSFKTPPSAIARAVELGVAWAESVVTRVCTKLSVNDWPAWVPFDEAKPKARLHVARLVELLHVHVAHPDDNREARTPGALARKRLSATALERICYDAARTRYAELAAWRYK